MKMRRCALRLRIDNLTKTLKGERGYILLTMLLALAFVTISAIAVLPEISQQVRREREEEMVHRGTAYMRAIQRYYRKMGRYPNRIEDLEDSNIGRCLRKRYTDPLSVDGRTGKEADFDLLHQQDIASKYTSLLGQTPEESVGEGQASAPQAEVGDAENAGSDPNTPAPDMEGAAPDTKASVPVAKTASASSTPPNAKTADLTSSHKVETDPNSPAFGGAIVGVVSKNRGKSIREFYGKNHYNEWLFVFLPQMGVIDSLRGPVNPNVPNGNIGQTGSGPMDRNGPNQGLQPQPLQDP